MQPAGQASDTADERLCHGEPLRSAVTFGVSPVETTYSLRLCPTAGAGVRLCRGGNSVRWCSWMPTGLPQFDANACPNSGDRSSHAQDLFAAVSQWPLVGPLLIRDATSYFTTEPMTTAFARVGEANYALDPLSSTGVEKAAQSATLAAFAIHTILEQPNRADLCIRFYRDRQRETISAHHTWAAEFYGSVARYAEMPFWRARSTLHGLTDSKPAKSTTSAATSTALAAAAFNLQTTVRMSERARAVEEPCIIDNQLSLCAALTHPNLDRPVAFLHDIALWPLLHSATNNMKVENLIDLWCAQIPAP